MAYRRKQGISRASTFKEEVYQRNQMSSRDLVHSQSFNQIHDNNHGIGIGIDIGNDIDNGNGDGSLAARAIRASAAHRDSTGYGYAYANADPSSSSSAYSTTSSVSHPHPHASFPSFSLPKDSYQSDNTMKDPNDSKYGFWGILARKAKSILEEDEFESSNRAKSQVNDPISGGQFCQSRQSSEGGTRMDNAKLRKRLDAITSSLNHLGDTIGNAFEEGRTIVEHKTADIIQETRKLQMRKRGGSSDTQDQAIVLQNTSWQRPVIQPVLTHALANQETQLKASRDVAMATAAKAKVLLRELKTVKADLAFAKERCAQLEEENKLLRESREKGDNPADDDLIRLQLETLLAEKARLAHENSIYARENRFLREIVEYHQLTMQDIVYLDEGAEEVTEVYPFSIDDAKVLSSTPTSPISPTLLPEVSSLSLPLEMKGYPREVPKDVCSTTTSQFSSSSPPKVSLPSCPPETKESPEVPTSSQRVDDEQKRPNFEGEDPERPSVLSA